jgi:hypothetical protein
MVIKKPPTETPSQNRLMPWWHTLFWQRFLHTLIERKKTTLEITLTTNIENEEKYLWAR